MSVTVSTTSYGRPALDALREVIAELKAGDPLEPVTVIVPNNIAGTVARRHLARGLTDDTNGVAGIWFTTLRRLAELAAAPTLTGAGRKPAVAAVTTAFVNDQLRSAPGSLAPVAEHPATTQALARAFRALRDVDDPMLDHIAEASALTADVVRLHRDAVQALSNDWYDATDLLKAACSRPVPDVGSLVFYLPQDLTRTELAFAEHLVHERNCHVIRGATADHRADRAPATVATALGADEAITAGKPAIATRVLHASDADDEVRAVVREVITSLASTPAHRVGILYSRQVPYARLLHEQLSAVGVRFNGPGARPLEERAMPRLLLGLLEAHRGGYRRADVLRAFGEVPALDVQGERMRLAPWERLSRGIGVIDDDDWSERVDAYVTEQQANLSEATGERAIWITRDISDAQQLRDTVTAVRAVMTSMDTSTSWSDVSTDLSEALEWMVPQASFSRMPPDEQYAAQAVLRAVNGLADLDLTSMPPSAALVEEVVRQQLEGGSQRVGRFGEGVFVGPVTDSCGLDLDVVFVLGLSEDQYPGRVGEDPLLPQRIREETDGQLPALTDIIERKYRSLLIAFQCAPTVVASFPRGDLREQTDRIPSRWLLPTLRHLADDPHLAATAYATASGVESIASFAAGVLHSADLASEQEWRTRASAAHEDFDDPAVDAAHHLLHGRSSEEPGRYDGIIGTEPPLPAVTGADAVVSPTALESYAVCPHAYFVQRVLRVRPVEEPEDVFEVSPADVGNVIHHCFDILISEAERDDELPGYGEQWTAAQRARLQVIAAEEGERLVATGRAGHHAMWARRLMEIKKQLDEMLTDDEVWRRSRSARIIGSEVRFGFEDSEPVDIVLANGIHVRIRGSADIVMQTQDGVLIVVDIKTGSSRGFEGLDEHSAVMGGTKLQLPAYAHAVRARFGNPDTAVEALYWFHGPKAKERITLPLTGPVQVTYADAIDRLTTAIGAGLFPPRAPAVADFLWVQCPYCNPDGLGHSEVRARWELIRTKAPLHDLIALIEPDALETTGGQS